MNRVIRTSVKAQLEVLQDACLAEIQPRDGLRQRLEASYEADCPLILKMGADPSRPDLHLGHSVVLRKIRQFQEFGHRLVFIIGDFTAMIGDPSGRNTQRPMLSREEVASNAKTYVEQLALILDMERTEIRYNSEWLSALTPYDLIRLLAKQTVSQMLARDDFAKRYTEENPIHLHELIYPVLTGYDSVAVRADIEFGGSDQLFNLLLGREIQKNHGQKPQTILTVPLIEGVDGGRKMSKSFGNAIALTDPPAEMFGKVMSISDPLMERYDQLLGVWSGDERARRAASLASGGLHPMTAKKQLGYRIVELLHGPRAAEQAQSEFENLFSRRQIPDELPVVELVATAEGCYDLLQLSVAAGFSSSRSEARRILQQGGMRLDQVTVEVERMSLPPGQTMIFRQGKRKLCRVHLLASAAGPKEPS